MSAMAGMRVYVVPRGATTVERASLRFAELVARWATSRAERREDRREAMLAAIKDAQTRKADPRDADRMLAQMGLPGR
jgi:alpha-D-ribose 1-methylphosphonate 5-triphosphate synthase subunit PhnG